MARKPMTEAARRKARKLSARKSHLKKTYGLTWDEYQAILEHQGGRCAICEGKRSYQLHVDHCHKTGRIRGLLCAACNKRLLPAAKDNPEVLLNAVDYIERPPARALGLDRVVPATAPSATESYDQEVGVHT
jgi:hypothetical protein